VSASFYATNTGLKIEASINAASVNGTKSAGYARLVFQVKLNISEEVGWHSREKVQAWSFGTLTGELFFGAEKIADIRSYSMNSRRWGGQNYPTDEYLNIEIPLDVRSIEWIELQRAGKSFEATLKINLQVQIFGSNTHTANFPCGLLDVSNVQGEISFIVPDTHWRERVLPGLGYGKVMIVELPAVSLESCSALGHSFKALENAQRQFSLGLYDESAGSCRVAFDQFFEQVDKGDGSNKTVPKLKKSWETTLGAATYQWLNTALGTIKDATNKPHHSPHNHFDRLGAQMLLTITTTLISYAAQQLSQEAQA